jgi:hypothetical protein
MPKVPAIIGVILLLFQGTKAIAKETPDDNSKCVTISPGPGFQLDGRKFFITAESFDLGDDVEGRIKRLYGNGAELADWQILKRLLAETADQTHSLARWGFRVRQPMDPVTIFSSPIAVNSNHQKECGPLLLGMMEKCRITGWF